MTDLEKAIAELRGVGAPRLSIRGTSAVLNAVASGELINVADLSDPLVVHMNMLNGTIAKPPSAQMAHIYAGELIPATERDAAVAAALHEAVAYAESLRDYGGLDQDGEPYLDEGSHLHGCGIANDIAVYLRTLITQPQADALARVRADAVKIKPLVWDDNGSADVYRVTFANGQGPKAFIVSRGSKIIGWHDDPNEAKAVAQADHEARIRAEIGGVE